MMNLETWCCRHPQGIDGLVHAVTNNKVTSWLISRLYSLEVLIRAVELSALSVEWAFNQSFISKHPIY